MTLPIETIEEIKAKFGLPQLIVEAEAAAIEAQTAIEGKISFSEALKLAIQSFLEDGRNYDSPVGAIAADPPANLPEVPDGSAAVSDIVSAWMGDRESSLPYEPKIALGATELVRSWMNDPNSKIILCTPDYQYLPEEGESIEDNWIFHLVLEQTPALHWAVVNRSGIKPVYNYGYS